MTGEKLVNEKKRCQKREREQVEEMALGGY
jgi:hypothetical protein